MALQAAYKQFLAAPNSANLTADASLYYITTTTAFHGATEIIKHLGSQLKQLKKNKEEVISAVESKDGLAVEVETTLGFLTGGGSYVPALDDNFLTDRIVYISITHFVSFAPNGKIAQIRQSWDQGALLKQLDVIGKSGRNWPIRDSVEQAKLIVQAVGEVKGAVSAASLPGSSAASDAARSRTNSNALRDPHASLELFAPRSDAENASAAVVPPYAGVRPRQRDITEILSDNPPDDTTPRAVISPYAGRRPRERSFTEILGDEDAGSEYGSEAGETMASRARSQSPSKVVAPKSGSGNNFRPVRLFEADEAAAAALDANSPGSFKSPERFYRPNPKKFNHFDFADGSDPQDAPKAGESFDDVPKTKHGSHWSFDDFTTPQKPPPRPARGQEVRHWALENEDMPETPSAASRKPAVAKPRRDAEPHFEFRDDGTPTGEARPVSRPRGVGHNEGLGLYENNLYKEDGSAPTPGPDERALGNITNLKDRSKIFEPHFTMTDEAPPAEEGSNGDAKQAPISDDRKKAVKMMESNWETSFDGDASKENTPVIPGTNVVVKNTDARGIQISGDGMGGKKSGLSWGFGDANDDISNPTAVPGKKQGTANQASSFWDF